MRDWFGRFAVRASKVCGSPWFFFASIVLTIAWLAAGPYYDWSEGWNFWANSSTTVATWILAVLLLHTQNKDTEAIQIKLAELIRANERAHDRLATIEDATEAEREQTRAELRQQCDDPSSDR